jgi:glycosyltransferase involved in cell wall biosynthesis
LISFYYPPDLSAGSFRTAALVKALLESDASVRLHVITTQPNRYQSFASSALETETHERLTVTRVKLPPHASGMRDQARAFLAYAREVGRISTRTRYDLVYGTSSRLMTAVLAARIAAQSGAPLYLDIRDIFVDTIGDVLPRPLSLPMRWAFDPLERWAIGRAARVNLVSEGFRPYFERRFPRQSFSFHTNGVDELFENIETTQTPRDPSTPIQILYAGNIGEGQGLHAIVPALASALGHRATLRIIGDGGRRHQLATALAASALADRVTLLPPVGRDALLEEYRRADVLFLHLNDYAAFEKVLPSKIFEYAALGKPILAGVGGYAAHFLKTEVTNAAVFAPCDAAAGVAALGTLELVDRPRAEFVARFRRGTVMRRLAADVLGAMRHQSEQVAQ